MPYEPRPPKQKPIFADLVMAIGLLGITASIWYPYDILLFGSSALAFSSASIALHHPDGEYLFYNTSRGLVYHISWIFVCARAIVYCIVFALNTISHLPV
ncbi:MAG TPA: hypothetical protein VG965_06620 [Patescibacteria group bacterium]|nr:hypothetical protein [Patescibacteria group bacterium]